MRCCRCDAQAPASAATRASGWGRLDRDLALCPRCSVGLGYSGEMRKPLAVVSRRPSIRNGAAAGSIADGLAALEPRRRHQGAAHGAAPRALSS